MHDGVCADRPGAAPGRLSGGRPCRAEAAQPQCGRGGPSRSGLLKPLMEVSRLLGDSLGLQMSLWRLSLVESGCRKIAPRTSALLGRGPTTSYLAACLVLILACFF